MRRNPILRGEAGRYDNINYKFEAFNEGVTDMKLILSVLILFVTNANAWETQTSVDKMSDSKIFVTSVKSKDKVWGGKKAELVILRICSKDEYQITIEHPFIIGDDGAEMRVDKQESKQVFAAKCASLRCLVLQEPDKILEDIQTAKNLTFRYTGAGSKQVTVEFNASGLDKELAKVPKLCKLPTSETN